MKKKMLFMAAIAGLVSLGSCVKDDVSASVEAVRNAKANELNAKANKDNADAEHTRAISAALVAVQQATARNTEALAKAQELTNQVKAAALEAEIAKQIAVYEKDLAQAKAQLQDELNNLEQSVRNAALAQYTDVATAIFDYNVALGIFTTAQKDVIAAKVRLAAAKNDAAHAEEIKENAIAAWEKDIENQEALIASLKEIEAEGVDIAEAKAQIAKLEAEVRNAMYEFENSDEVKALVEAGEALAEAKGAFGVVSAVSFDNVNAMVADALGSNVTDYYKAGVLQPLTWLPAGFKYDSDGDQVDDKTVAAPWGGTYTDYYQQTGAKTIKSKVAGYGFYDYTSYQYQFTADNYDEHGCPVPGTCSVTGKASVADGVMDDVPALVKSGDAALDGSNFSVKQYRVNELTKNAADEYFLNYPTNSKVALDNAKDELKELEAQLGTPSDAKDKKYTKNDGTDGGLTDYATLALANENLATAKTNKATAETNLSGKPAALKTAITNLMAENGKGTPDPAEQLKLTIKLAEAIEAVYGTAANRASLPMEITTQANANNYVYGATTALDFTSNTDVENLFKWGSTFVATTGGWKTGADATHDGVDYVVKVINRKTGSKSVVEAYDDAVTALGDDTPGAETGAYLAVANAKKAINGTYNADNQLIVKGTIQKIADKKDDIAKKTADNAKADAIKAQYEAAIGAADVEAYDEAAAALSEAADNYNAAAKAVAGWVKENITDKNTEIAALRTVVKKQDIPAQIKAAEAQIANDKQNIANWENIETTPGAGDFDNNAEAIIAQAEVDLVDAIAALASATADLMAAQAQLEAIVGDLDIEYEYDLDDEPAEEPSEEPAEEPAEGGEETPAEGEGEAEGEGGEEA